MSNVNTVAIGGRLTRNPESIASGKGCRFGLASNRSFKRQGDDEWTEERLFVDVTAWSGLSEQIMKKLTKGSIATVQGRLEMNEYEAADGNKRQTLRIVALEVDSPAFFVKGATAEQAQSLVEDAEGATAEQTQSLPVAEPKPKRRAAAPK